MEKKKTADNEMCVPLFHASLLWPLQLEPLAAEEVEGRHWEVLEALEDKPWQRIDDEFTADPGMFQERHYREFVSFLPYAQRFLYGKGRSSKRPPGKDIGASPVHVFRRQDVASLRLTLRPDSQPMTLDVVHIDLYFFHDLDLMILNPEVRGNDLPLSQVRNILFRFGRAYPSGWNEEGSGLHNAYLTEWLGRDGRILTVSDSEHRSKFLKHVCAHRSPGISEHWAWLLLPMVLAHSDRPGEIRYRLIEYHRMPSMAYLAVDNPRLLKREDWVRIGLATVMHPDDPLPGNEPSIKNFVRLYCQDRYWQNSESGPNARFICTGNAFTVVGDASSEYFRDAERGALAQFRHQHFVIFLIAHVHRASLLIFSEILSDAVNDLNIRNQASVGRFKRRIRANFETFLRFTHRYWFHELSERPHLQALSRLCSRHLRNDSLYDDVRDSIREMSHYLDSDSQRRQSNTVVRLTVITTLGLIATVTTGYFGMNIIPFGEGSVDDRLVHGVVATVVCVSLVLFAIARSKRLSDFLETLAEERVPFGEKMIALSQVIWPGRRR